VPGEEAGRQGGAGELPQRPPRPAPRPSDRCPTHFADGIGPGVFRFPDGPGGKAAEHGLFPSVLIFELFQRPFDVALQALPGG